MIRRLPLRLSLRAWLLGSYFAVLCLPWLALVGSGALDTDLRWQTRENLTAQGHVWALQIEAALADGDELPEVAERLRPVLAEARRRTLCGTQIVDADGIVVASTGARIGHTLREDPEVGRALTGTVAASERPRAPVDRRGSAELDGPSRFAAVRSFVAVPIEQDGRVVGAVVTSRTPREELQALVHMAPQLAWATAAILGLTLLLALGSGHLGSRSFEGLASAARSIAAGSREAPKLDELRGSHIREVVAVSDAMQAMHAKLQARLDYIDEFAGNVAHEFRTPIATLRGTLELLHDEPEMPIEQRERFFANAQAELGRLQTLVDGLLTLARAERPTDRAPVDLDAIVREVAEREGLEVEGRAGVVFGSARQLELVVDNLVANARQHGGPGVTVRLVAHCDDERVGFDVVDDGVGIAASDLPRVFDRFFTTDRRRGIGLGLALVDLVVRAHGGRVSVDSRPGATRFAVRLPVADARPERLAPPRSEP